MGHEERIGHFSISISSVFVILVFMACRILAFSRARVSTGSNSSSSRVWFVADHGMSCPNWDQAVSLRYVHICLPSFVGAYHKVPSSLVINCGLRGLASRPLRWVRA